MKAYFYFFEDYIDFVFLLAEELKVRFPSIEFTGLAARRKTSCQLIESQKARLSIKSYDWLGALEKEWLAQPVDAQELKRLENLIGTQNMRHLIISDRELGHGYMTGGIYSKTPLRKMVEKNGELRWRYIVGALRYYENKFSEEKPNFVFFNEFTMAYELAAYFMAKAYAIPCFCLFYSRYGDVFVVDDNPYNLFSSVERLFKRAVENEQVLLPESLERADVVLNRYQNAPEVPSYSKYFRQKAVQQGSSLRMLVTLCTDLVKWVAIALGAKGSRGFLRQRRGWDILKTNLGVWWQTKRTLWGRSDFESEAVLHELLKQDYIYYPLHVEPEASTTVLSPEFSNQLTIIEHLSRSMPAGFKLLVKEHLPMIGLRPKGFYQKLKAMPDIHLISPFADNFNLIRKSKLVAVITGTAAWEAIVLGKPAVSIGCTQFDCLGEGLLKLDSFFGLEQQLQTAMDLPVVSRDKIRLLIAATIQEGIDLPIGAYAYAHYGAKGKRLFSENREKVKLFADKIISLLPEDPK